MMQMEQFISCQNFDLSPAVENLVRRRTSVLLKRYDQIAGCDVMMDAANKKMPNGREYRVKLNMDMLGPDSSVYREIAQGSAQDDLILAVKRAFGAAEKSIKKRNKVVEALS